MHCKVYEKAYLWENKDIDIDFTRKTLGLLLGSLINFFDEDSWFPLVNAIKGHFESTMHHPSLKMLVANSYVKFNQEPSSPCPPQPLPAHQKPLPAHQKPLPTH